MYFVSHNQVKYQLQKFNIGLKEFEANFERLCEWLLFGVHKIKIILLFL